MSGGRFNYQDSSLQIEIFGWIEKGDRIPDVFEDREISELTYDLFNLIHDYDWYASGDTDKEDYLKSKEAFKKKWFGNREARVKYIVDKAIAELRDDLYETYGFVRESEVSK